MPHSTLRDLAKVGAGLVIADMLVGIWLASGGLLPVSILGVTWTADMLPAAFVFDGALLILLVHLGWRVRLPVSSPSERSLLAFSGTVFLVVALLHLTRLMFDWQLALGGFMIPLWLSWFGFAITLYLSYASFHYVLHGKRR
ncbi:MAG: hypothetical protein KGI78_01770 [Patescibacteria group bacterium]|nr:hypothetical protein [Patescibacteria group bacterium]MDE1944218.1 hypothetical protein [Patescibacteria group bacterium]MDE1945487.1 hypothetical protein [Patescibacteria group bacterium]MDE2057563.1 hypothetical protein [Patescibacteria group bacterium]